MSLRTFMLKSLVLVALVGIALFGAVPHEAQAQAPAAAPAGFVAGDSPFVENLGQWDDQASFRLGIDGATVWLTDRGVMHHVVDPAEFEIATSGDPEGKTDEPVGQHAVYATYKGGQASEVVGERQLSGVYNFLVGAEEKHRTGARLYSSVLLRSIYDGIDARVSTVKRAGATDLETGSGFEVSYEIAPNADLSQLVIDYVGADYVTLDDDGDLHVGLTFDEFVELHPTAYQMTNDVAEPVPAWFEVSGTEVQFGLGAAYDASKTLYIDPVVLYSVPFIAGSSSDYAAEMQKDSSGYYFTGQTYSSNWPVTSGAYDDTLGGSYDWTATKMSLDMQTLYWTTYIGGDYYEYTGNSALASDGSLYIAGATYNPKQYNFPYDYDYFNSTSTSTSYDCAVFHLSANGASKVSAMVYGSTSSDYCSDVELDANGNVLVVGNVYSTSTLLTVPGYDTSYAGSYDPFVARFSADLGTFMDFT
ncbi:MAG: hypothetical protein ACK2UL_00050, partial [Anaerolineae bacterium]